MHMHNMLWWITQGDSYRHRLTVLNKSTWSKWTSGYWPVGDETWFSEHE